MNRKQAEILLASVILARASANVFTKIGISTFDKFNILALRAVIALMLLLPLFHKKLHHLKPRTLLRGALMGGSFFIILTCESLALRTVEVSTLAFLENTAIVIVPVAEALVARHLPGKDVVLSACLAIFGVGLMTLGGGTGALGAGVGWCLAVAVVYSGLIMMTSRFTREDDAMTLGVLQVCAMGVCSLLSTFLLESPRLPANPKEWGLILALALVCTGFGFTLQPVAQSHTTSQRASLFCALSPAFSAILGFICFRESMGLNKLLGAALILISIFIPKIIQLKKQKN